MGKSKAIERWVMQAIRTGATGICVIDPHGDLFQHLRDYLAAVWLTQAPHLNQRVCLLDPTDPNCQLHLNPLELLPGEEITAKADFLSDTIVKVFNDDPQITFTLQQIMLYTFMALIEQGKTLIDVPKFLADMVDDKKRAAGLRGITNPDTRLFWLEKFPPNRRLADDRVRSTDSRMGQFAIKPEFKRIFGRAHGNLDIQNLIENRQILLVNTSKGALGDDASRMLGAFVVAQIQQAAMRRRDRTYPFLLVLDEFQNYVSDSITTLMEETGKCNVWAMVSHQHKAQIDNKKLAASIYSQCNDLIAFDLGVEDAEELATAFFRPDIDQVKEVRTRYQQLGGVIYAFQENVWRSENEIWASEKRKLSDQAKRKFWHKRRAMPAVECMTFDLPDPATPRNWIDTFKANCLPMAEYIPVGPASTSRTDEPPLSPQPQPQPQPVEIVSDAPQQTAKQPKNRSERIPLWAPD